jgi:hypothetical protein
VAAGLSAVPAETAGIFAPGEPVRVRIAGPGPVAWQLHDFAGTTVAHGKGAGGVIALGGRSAGYYTLDVTGPAGSAAVPIAVIPRPVRRPADPRFQVVTHFALGWPTDLLPLAQRAGIAGIRDELPWNVIEKPADQFQFPPNLDGYVTKAHDLGLQVLVPLDYANPAYDGGETPYSLKGIAGFAGYAAVLATHFGDRISAFEVWNEYNGAFATGPVLADRPGFYARLLNSTAAAIRRVRPGTTVVGGGVAGNPLPYWDRLLADGVAGDMDVAQIHPYQDVPEDAGYDVAALKARLGTKPLWATEAGAYDPKDRRNTAALLVRLAVTLLGSGVDRVYWYALRDDPNFPIAGLIETTGDPAAPYAAAPAYASYSTLIRELAGSRFVAREKTDPRTRIYSFAGAGGETRVAWTVAGPTTLRLHARRVLVVTGLDGAARRVRPQHGVVTLALGPDPIYIKGAVSGLAEDRPDRQLTDSVEDFGGRQGDGAWRYGTVVEGGTTFQPATWTHNDWSFYWADPAFGLFSVGRTTAHPSVTADGTPVAAVRRWQSPVDGPARIDLTARRDADQGDGVRVEIRLDGKTVATAELGTPGHGKAATLVLPVQLRKGSLVDIAVLPATSRLDGDTTVTRIRITQ